MRSFYWKASLKKINAHQCMDLTKLAIRHDYKRNEQLDHLHITFTEVSV